MSENCDTVLWCRILRTGYLRRFNVYKLDVGKVNSSDDSSRCLVKSGRIMTGRAMYSSKREEEKLLQPGHWVTEDSFQGFQDQWEGYIVSA